MELGPRVSGYRALGVPGLVCQPTGGWGWGPEGPGAGVCPLVCGARSWTGQYPRVAVSSGCLKEACLLGGGAVPPPH